MRQSDTDAPGSDATGGADSTTRERIADLLRADTATASDLAVEFGITASSARNHVRHVARSLDNADEQLLAIPPECRDCGFDAFDDRVNHPSRCPDCKSEAIEEPVFTVKPMS